MLINDSLGSEASGSHIMHPGSRKLFIYWEKLRAERAYPDRSEIDLGDLRELMPDLIIAEKDHLRKSYRFRLAGTRVCDLFRKNLTSQDLLSGWDAFEADVIGKHLALTFGQHQPILMRLRLTTDAKQVVAAEFLGLPVESDDSRIQILGGFFPFRPALHLGHSAIIARELLAIRSIWTEHTKQPQPEVERGPTFRVIEGGLKAR